MIPQAAVWIWFGAAWVFILGVLIKRWYHREHVAKAATDEALKRCRSDTSGDHIWDAS
jgi:uncharacterized membrane protein